MPTAKDEIRDLLNELPDDVSFEDAVYQMYIHAKVHGGLADAEAGERRPPRR